MQQRLYTLTAAFRCSKSWTVPGHLSQRPQTNNALYTIRQKGFRTAPTVRWFSQSYKTAAKAIEQETRYKSRLLIYTAGDGRTTWITFWKAMAILQFGTTLVFGVPLLWRNEKQPDVNLRKLQAVLVGVLAAIPSLTLAYVTAPFVHQVFLQIPEHARRGRHELIRFARTLNTNLRGTANTKVEFVTLRIFPFRKHTAAFLHELRALPPKKMRLANIELPKTDDWAKKQREKGIFRRVFEVVKEPRFKFYVKEGHLYTMKTGVPGVWEEVAKRIQQQTLLKRDGVESTQSGVKKAVMVRKSVKPLIASETKQVSIKRQTSRPQHK